MASGSGRGKPSESDTIKILRISEGHKTARWAIVAAVVLLSIAMIIYAVIKISEKTWWEMLFAIVLAALGIAAGGQSLLFWRINVRIRRYTASNQGRVADLEKAKDPDRSSSALLPDGTNPPEDRV